MKRLFSDAKVGLGCLSDEDVWPLTETRGLFIRDRVDVKVKFLSSDRIVYINATHKHIKLKLYSKLKFTVKYKLFYINNYLYVKLQKHLC